MSKGIKEVRKSIMKRKRMRHTYAKKASYKQQILPIFPQDEEKHGYLSDVHNDSLDSKRNYMLKSRMVIKGVLAIGLFFAIALILTTDAELLRKPQSWTRHALTEEFPFARVNQWYQQTFGSPLAFNPKNEQLSGEDDALAIPVNGNVTESFQANGTGIKIAPKKAGPVLAWHDGIIIFAGNDRETEKTVIIQHADNSKTIYGHLSSIDVHLYQYVTPGQTLGVFNPTEMNQTVYFAIEKNDEFIDPIQVIEVDDRK